MKRGCELRDHLIGYESRPELRGDETEKKYYARSASVSWETVVDTNLNMESMTAVRCSERVIERCKSDETVE